VEKLELAEKRPVGDGVRSIALVARVVALVARVVALVARVVALVARNGTACNRVKRRKTGDRKHASR